jgi:hypothetical protein
MHSPKTSNNKDTKEAHENGVDAAAMNNGLISKSHDRNRLKNI